ncbi:Hsp20/alpha crystallin family protein [Patescibacteria group bacterium]|nr:Hsp20/alpha crystallin family protein [Patescibacteria group bacterium]MBU1563708.1 Hsp20/alpha crystallin family protein [Patescibacteria group bacterium]MBU2068167.1 Hsp20/alpha crystallin family protein [Patescibacteria group bacterium]
MSPSFFEKITGANFLEEDASEKAKKSAKNKITKKTASKSKAIEKDVSVEQLDEKAKKITMPKEFTESENINEEKKSEEWLTESEGQLTIDVYQTPTEIVIKSTIAGVSPDAIDISMTNDMITIKGNRKKDEEAKEEDYYYQECYWGPFSRSVILPVDVEVDNADAGMKNGILTIRLPKIEKIKTKKIEIKSE